jgi:hypothetical protein
MFDIECENYIKSSGTIVLGVFIDLMLALGSSIISMGTLKAMKLHSHIEIICPKLEELFWNISSKSIDKYGSKIEEYVEDIL